MPSEEFDKIIKEAADHHHPSYDEKAWAKMEKLLDTHLPQKKDDRRFIFFLLFFLLIGGGAYLMITRPWQPGKAVVVADKELQQNVPVNPGESTVVDDAKKINPGNIIDDNASVDKDKVINAEKKQSSVIVRPNNPNNREDITVSQRAVDKRQPKDHKFRPVISEPEVRKNIPAQVANDKTGNEISSYPDDNVVAPATKKVIANNSNAEQKLNNAANIDSSKKISDVVLAPAAKKARGNKKKSNFFLSLSSGMDLSSVKFQTKGKLKPVFGIGAGYTIADRFTIRTGFYTGRKVYTVGPADYKLASGPNWNYLSRINADCEVYEIPVNFAYNFGKSESHKMFTAVGLSTFIMKKENYDYLYEYPNGTTYSRTKVIDNEYKHYFSVLTLSGGYQYKINKTFSLTAEPYIKFPLTGIGFGKVKLNSGGVLFSLGIKPFNSTKNKNKLQH